MKTRIILSALLFLLFAMPLFSQKDSLVLSNGDILVGELKNMDRGVATIETDYSDSDFKIEWDGIIELFTDNEYLITLSDGSRFNGRLQSISPDSVNLITVDEGIFGVPMDQIVFLKEVDKGFASRIYFSIDLGFSLTQAQNLRQVTLRSTAGYLADRWSVDANFNTLNSRQDEVEDIRRIDAEGTFRWFLPKDWYLLPALTFLSNTEQKLRLRTIAKFGIGKYIIHTNQTYWGISAGVSYNNERFFSENPDRNSFEAYFGSELNMFDIGDLNLLARANAYPSLTERQRWRFDAGLDVKYDFPLDFYIKFGLTFNFDNQPIEGASRTDYVFQSTIGWEW